MWSLAEEEETLQMTATQLAIQVSMLVLESLPIGEEISWVPYAWSINGYGLNLPSFQLMLDTPEPKAGTPAPVAPVEAPLKEGVGQRRDNSKGNNSIGDGNAVLVEDAPLWTGTHQVEPSPILSGGGELKQDELYAVCAGPRACLFGEGEGYHMRMRTGQLPTKMSDAKTPILPPYAHHTENEPSSGG